MSNSVHALQNNKQWKFNKPYIGYTIPYKVMKESGDIKHTRHTGLDTCRENLITNVRAHLNTYLTNYTDYSARLAPSWDMIGRVDLTSTDKDYEKTVLKIDWSSPYKADWPAVSTQEFIKVCDRILGSVCVLLGPWRPKGKDWWITDPKTCRYGNLFVWSGSDNWFLAHPAMVAIATGMLRQCHALCGAGLADEIISTIREEDVAEVMSTNGQALALKIVNKLRPFIEVPPGNNGIAENYVFPIGSWRRLILLQRAIRRNKGYEKALGETFEEGWQLGPISNKIYANYTGLHAFWGTTKKPTKAHQHLEERGKLRRAKNGRRAVKKTS